MQHLQTSRALATRVLLAGALLLISIAQAGAEFRLPASEGRQSQPAVASDARGGFVVVWKEHFPGAAQPLDTIRFQRFGPDGKPAGGNTRVDLLPGDNARNPAVDMAPDGSFVVVWEGGASEGRNRRTIWARRFAPDGKPRGTELRVNTQRLQTLDPAVREWRYGGPAVSIAPAGGFVVVWHDNGARRCNDSNIVMRRFDADGETIGKIQEVNTDLELEHFHPAVDHDAKGNFVVVWQKGALLESRDERGVIQGRRFNLQNEANTPPFTISDGRGFSSAPSLAVSPDGAFSIVWLEHPPDSDRSTIVARRFAAEGDPSPQIEVATTSLGFSSRPTIAVAPGQGPAIVWTGRSDDPWVGTVIRARHMDSAGNSPGGQRTLGPVTCLNRESPAAAAMPNGDVLAVWQVENSTAIEGMRARPHGSEVPIASLGPTIAEQWRALIPTEDRFPDEEDRREAARTIGCFRYEAPGAAPILLEVLVGDPSTSVRRAAATSLAMVTRDAPSILQTLLEYLSDRSPEIRIGAAQGLGLLGQAEAAGPLAVLLESDDTPKVRAAAASALADISRRPETGPTITAEIRKILMEAADDRELDVREAVFGALSRLPKPPRDLPDLMFEKLFEVDPFFVLDKIAKMGPAGRSAAPRVQKALEHPQYIVRWRAIRCLLKIRSGDFSHLLFDPEPLVRIATANGLRRLGRTALFAASTDIEKAVRVETDDRARAAVDGAWESLQEAHCAEEWFDRLDLEVWTPPVTKELSVPVKTGKDLQTRLSEYVYILASPSGELIVELASDVSKMALAGEISEENPWFVVYQEDRSDPLRASGRRSVLRIKSQAELIAIVDAANPGWKDRIQARPRPHN